MPPTDLGRGDFGVWMCAGRSPNASDSNNRGFCQSVSARNNWIAALLQTDRFRPSLGVWQVLGITNQFKTAHETQVIHNETPNQDYEARLNLLSRNYRDGEAARDGDERRVGGGWRKPLPPPPHGFGSSISLSGGSAPHDCSRAVPISSSILFSFPSRGRGGLVCGHCGVSLALSHLPLSAQETAPNSTSSSLQYSHKNPCSTWPRSSVIPVCWSQILPHPSKNKNQFLGLQQWDGGRGIEELHGSDEVPTAGLGCKWSPERLQKHHKTINPSERRGK